MKEKWGILAGDTGYFTMDEVEVPEENLLGRPGEGFKIAMSALDQGRFTVAAGATGLIRACRDASVAYAKERKAFGVEIGQHQLVKEMIAQMESDYQSARLLWLRAGWLKNTGQRNTRETGLAKWFATVASERAAGDAVQIHGANGYSDEYPVGRFYRNCKGAVIYEGTREIHKLMQADYLLGYRTDRPARCELPAVADGRRLNGLSDLADVDSWTLISRSNFCASSNRRRSRARTRWGTAIATSPIRSPSRRCARSWTRCRSTGRSSSAKASATRRRCSTSARRWASSTRRGSRASGMVRFSEVDIAVDPLEGTNLCATGAPNAIAVLAASEKGGLLHAPDLYMEKLVVGPTSKDHVSLDASPADNLKAIAKRLGRDVDDLVVIVLDRPRHEQLIEDIRATGARIRLIGDGDLSAGIAAAVVGSGVHAVMGTGGAPEGVLTAAAMRCLNGEIFARLVVSKPEHEERCRAMGITDFKKVYRSKDLAPGKSIIFAATGVTDGTLMKGVRFFGDGIRTSSVIMQNDPHQIRFIDSIHVATSKDGRIRF